LLSDSALIRQEAPYCRSATSRRAFAAIKSGISTHGGQCPFGIEAERLKLNVVADSVKMDIPFFNTGLLGSKRFLTNRTARS